MSLLDYLFDNEWKQRSDLNALDTRADAMSSNVSGLDGQVRRMSGQLVELAATVRVLVRKLEETGQLDRAKLAAEIKAEIRQPTQADGERVQTRCVRCGQQSYSDEMVRAGADTWCRACARNP